ncbi:hypothetical protein [Nocardioides psychrotolerans]|uniref:hypothetical protein n=1 Tax=Nocardioides psychrotolerans TaxID=1005945 RepID=UPI00313805E4
MSRNHLLTATLLTTLAALVATLVPAAAHARPIEGYASYAPQSTCSPKAKPGTVYLGRWLVRHYGGGFGSISRRCSDSTSEHQEGRAFDWRLDAANARDRARAARFLERIRRTDHGGNTDAWARRMGVMYVIWNDRMYSAWDGFRPEPYLSSSCRTKKRCSKTLRHRDHLHVSLSRRGGWGNTSWYDGRLRR